MRRPARSWRNGAPMQALVARHGVVVFDLGEQRGVAQTYGVAFGGAVHCGVLAPRHLCHGDLFLLLLHSLNRITLLILAGGSPAADYFSCAAKKSNQKKAAQVSRLLFEEVTLRCLTRRGDCATRPGKAHTTCLPMGLEQCSSTTPHRVELLGASYGVKLQPHSPASQEKQETPAESRTIAAGLPPACL